jgi:type II secretory pathway pseudopilin PulG
MQKSKLQFKNQNFKQKKGGFTILETLVAITILSTAILGPMELASKSIVSAGTAQNQIKAFYLTQEAMEYIRNIRDTNLINGNPWITGGSLNLCVSGDCIVDVPQDSIAACVGTCPKIRYDDSTGFYYNYISGDETIFIRTARITNPVSGNLDEAKITVTTSWDEQRRSKSLTLNSYIFEWK